jgi:hypothetical protein
MADLYGKYSPSPPSIWLELRAEFTALNLRQFPQSENIIFTTPIKTMYAVGKYSAKGRNLEWKLEDCQSEDLKACFELTATQAGKALRTPAGTDSLDYWLDRLALNLSASKSDHFQTGTVAEFRFDVVKDVCAASAMFCAKLARAEIEGTFDDLALRESVSYAVDKVFEEAETSESGDPGPDLSSDAPLSNTAERFFWTKTKATSAQASAISEQLDEAAINENISHEEQAFRIGIGRTAYFEVKAGRGGRKARTRALNYLSALKQKQSRKVPE